MLSGISALLLLTIPALASPVLQGPRHALDKRTTTTDYPSQTFVSSPFRPPVLDIQKSGAALADGLLFFGAGDAEQGLSTVPVQTSPLIMTDSGQLVWSGANGTFAANFKASTIHGSPVLSYFSGKELSGPNVGHFYGKVVVLNSTYDEIYTICPKLNLTVPEGINQSCEVDGHESYILDNGNIVVTAYNITTADLSPIGGPKKGYINDCLFYVFDIPTQKQLFSWSSLAHVPISQTRYPLDGAGTNSSNPFDYFHINSVQPIGDKFLVNGRHTWSSYLISSTGAIIWTINGATGGDFGTLPSNAHFHWQHDARINNATSNNITNVDPAIDPITLRMFNNNNAIQDNGTNPSNGLLLYLVPPTGGKPGTAQFLSADQNETSEYYSVAQGSNQLLANGNEFLNYGFIPVSREFGPKGDTRMTLRFGADNAVQTYRMFRQTWHATPRTRPSLVVKCTKGYVSWNGATDVTQYAVYEGPAKQALKQTAKVASAGFETSFTTTGSATKYVLVEAYEGSVGVRNSSIVAVSGC